MNAPALLTRVVDAAEAIDSRADDAVGGFWMGDVARDGRHIRTIARLDGARIGDDAIAAVEEPLDQARPDPL